MSRWIERALLVGALSLAWVPGARAGDAGYGLGRAPSPQEIAGWDIDARGGDGKGLPPGAGSVAKGDKLFAAQCASCHGDFGEGVGLYPPLAGGKGTLASASPQKTVGSYWPYAPTLFDYIRRAMPLLHPGSLSDGEIYSVIAYILNLNDILPQDAQLDAASLAAISMPNRDGFITKDPRPDVKSEACMTNCKPGPVRVTSSAAKGVTPGEEAAGKDAK